MSYLHISSNSLANSLKMRLLALVIMAAGALAASAEPERMFPYPEPPEELTSLSDRTNYLVEHFWERCQLPSAILFKEQFGNAFNDWISFMPYADADVVHAALDKFLANFAKDPEKMLTLASMAEQILYEPNGEFVSDELYYPFAKMAAGMKKIPAADKARFAEQAAILAVSQVGMDAPNITFTRPDGSKGQLNDIRGAHTLILFDTPDCDDCFLARVKLSADANVNELIEKGQLNVVYIAVTEPDEAWKSRAAGMNGRWIVGAAPDAGKVYDMRNKPTFYYLNPQGKILSKTLVIDGLLEAFRRANPKSTTVPGQTITSND